MPQRRPGRHALAKFVRRFPHTATKSTGRINSILCAARPCKMLCGIKLKGRSYNMKILEAFADDTLCTGPAVCKGNPAHKKALQSMCETAKALDEQLTDEGKKLFEQFSDAQSDEGRLYAVDHFVRGYRDRRADDDRSIHRNFRPVSRYKGRDAVTGTGAAFCRVMGGSTPISSKTIAINPHEKGGPRKQARLSMNLHFSKVSALI